MKQRKSNEIMYCERRYFRVNIFSRIYENGQFRVYLNSRFKYNWLFRLLEK